MSKRVYGKRCRPVVIVGDTAIITLTRGMVTIIDIEDLHIVDSYNWHVWMKNGMAPCAIRIAYPEVGIKQTILMHREIMLPKDGLEVDHVNRNPLDNRRSNLRVVKGCQNNLNKSRYSNNTSNFKGVTWHEPTGMWRARIQKNGKRVSLGYFPDAGKAGKAYDKAAIIYHGEFAACNSTISQHIGE